MLMEISHLSMEERLQLWKQRKSSGLKNPKAGDLAAKTATTPKKTPVLEASGSGSGSGSTSKLMRKRNRKYINSALSNTHSISHTLPLTHSTTPHTKHNPMSNKSCFEIQKRTKKENDDPNFNNRGDHGKISMNNSELENNIIGIDDGMEDMHISNVSNTSQDVPSSTESNTISELSESLSSFSSGDSEKMDKLKAENVQLTKDIQAANHERKAAFKIAHMSVDENKALQFENDVLHQTIEDLEMQLSQSRMNAFETDVDTDKIKKQSATIRFLRQKNEEYENRANTMVAEMTEQMATLQEMAMSRIQQLEGDLMLEQHKTQTQEATILKLQQTLEERKNAAQPSRRCRRRTARRQSTFMSIGSLDGSDSDATVEAGDKENGPKDDADDELEDEGFDLAFGDNNDDDDDNDSDHNEETDM